MSSKWSPVDKRAFITPPIFVDLEEEAGCAPTHLENALDSLPELLIAGAGFAQNATARLRALSLMSRCEDVLKYEEAGGVIIASELAGCIQYLAEALGQVTMAQTLLAKSNVSTAAAQLVEWNLAPPEEPGSNSGPGPGPGPDDLFDEGLDERGHVDTSTLSASSLVCDSTSINTRVRRYQV